MARKTTKLGKVAIERWTNQRKHFEDILRIKEHVAIDCQADHVRSRSVDYWMGRIEGAIAAVEEVLFDTNCYHGFKYVDHAGNDLQWFGKFDRVTDHPDFKEWRRHYFIVE